MKMLFAVIVTVIEQLVDVNSTSEQCCRNMHLGIGSYGASVGDRVT